MSDNNNKTYEQGMLDGIQLYGKVCSTKGNCDQCPLKTVAGIGVTCTMFAASHPTQALAVMKNMNGEELTYFDVYNMRFPASGVSLENLSQTACRKAIFEGYCSCEDDMDCMDCWKMPYRGDVTESRD